MTTEVYVVNTSRSTPLYVDVMQASRERRPQIREGAANAMGPYKGTRPDDEQPVGVYRADSPAGLAVFLYLAQRNEPSFERFTVPASVRRAVIYFDGSTEHATLRKDEPPIAATPLWLRWTYVGIAGAVIAAAVAFVIYKSIVTRRQR